MSGLSKDDIIRMTQEAFGAEHELFWMNGTDEYLERFANLVAAAEREACANVAAWILKMPENDVSTAIRARGNNAA
jgi:hypothetical protein